MLGFVACGESSQPSTSSRHLVSRDRMAMGSILKLSAWTSDEPKAVAAFNDIFHEFDRLEDLMSVWRPNSDVVRMNQAAGDHPVPISDDTRAVLLAARQASEWTNGKFDITFGALADIWKFDQDQDNTVPGADAIRARLPFVDYTVVQVDGAAKTGFITKKGSRIHLGGVGKGYAVDKAIDLLRGRGFADFLIQSGGDMFVGGLNDGKPWRLGIKDPRGNGTFATLDLSDGTFSTSGDYERSFIKDGRRYHHLIDPDLGEPARGCRSVTIVASRATLADVLSTGVFIMGPKDGMALIEHLPDVEGVIVSSTNEVLVSSGLKGRIRLLSKPTDAP
jgi:thiamine biosynthesis lipoprotein